METQYLSIAIQYYIAGRAATSAGSIPLAGNLFHHAAEMFLNTAAAARVRTRLFAPGETLHAPHLIDLEIAQVLRRYAAARDLGPDRGVQALDDLQDLPLMRYPHDVFLPRIWQLRHNATAYDAVYLALAEALEAPLLTRDVGLLSVRGHGARVELV